MATFCYRAIRIHCFAGPMTIARALRAAAFNPNIAHALGRR